MLFQWDENKNISNEKKYGIDFVVARRIFEDKYLITFDDSRKDYQEIRAINIGLIKQTLILTVVTTDRDNTKRIISARKANKNEKIRYFKQFNN